MDWFRAWGLALVLGLLSGLVLLLFRVRSYVSATGLSIDLETGYRFALTGVLAAIGVVALILGIAAVTAARRSRSDAPGRRELTR